MCRDWQTREDGDVMSSTAAEGQIKISISPTFGPSRRDHRGIDSDPLPSQVISFNTNTASPLASLTINSDWVNLYRHNSHYVAAKCQRRRPCCDELFGGLLKLWHLLTNDWIIWEEVEKCHRVSNWSGVFFCIKKRLFSGFTLRLEWDVGERSGWVELFTWIVEL